jgi:hypothetical protein
MSVVKTKTARPPKTASVRVRSIGKMVSLLEIQLHRNIAGFLI